MFSILIHSGGATGGHYYSYTLSLNGGVATEMRTTESVEDGYILEYEPFKLVKESKKETFAWIFTNKETKEETALVTGLSFNGASLVFIYDDPDGKNGIKARIEFEKTTVPPGPVDHITKTGIYSTTSGGVQIATETVYDDKSGLYQLSIGGTYVLKERTGDGIPPNLFDFVDTKSGDTLFSNATFENNQCTFEVGKDSWRISYTAEQGPTNPIRSRIITKDLTKLFIKSLL